MKIDSDYVVSPVDPTEPRHALQLYSKASRTRSSGYEVLESGQLVYLVLGSSKCGRETPNSNCLTSPAPRAAKALRRGFPPGGTVLDDGEVAGSA
jgi:hypothetical protein